MRWSCLLLLFMVPPGYGMDEFEISVWSPDGVELHPAGEHGIEYRDDAGNTHYDHPCGSVQKMTVAELPPPDSDDFITRSEKVFELNEDRQVIESWSMPVDSWLMGIDGKEIIVSYFRPVIDDATGERRYEPSALAIHSNGALRLAERQKIEPEWVECEAAVQSNFGETAYGSCQVLHDAESGEERVILYQLPCT